MCTRTAKSHKLNVEPASVQCSLRTKQQRHRAPEYLIDRASVRWNDLLRALIRFDAFCCLARVENVDPSVSRNNVIYRIHIVCRSRADECRK